MMEAKRFNCRPYMFTTLKGKIQQDNYKKAEMPYIAPSQERMYKQKAMAKVNIHGRG